MDEENFLLIRIQNHGVGENEKATDYFQLYAKNKRDPCIFTIYTEKVSFLVQLGGNSNHLTTISNNKCMPECMFSPTGSSGRQQQQQHRYLFLLVHLHTTQHLRVWCSGSPHTRRHTTAEEDDRLLLHPRRLLLLRLQGQQEGVRREAEVVSVWDV